MARRAWSLAAIAGLVSALAGTMGSALIAGVGAPDLAAATVGGLVAGLAAYAAVRRRLSRRLSDTRSALAGVDNNRGYAGDDFDQIVAEADRAGRDLRAEIGRLERLSDYRRSFLGDVSHELRTPIFAISGFAESLLDGALDDPQVRERFVQKIHANARRLDSLARDLAEIARIESGELRMRTAPFDVAAVARETLETLESLARERGVEISFTSASDVPRVLGDRGRIQQVLGNLLENAIRYSEPGGHARLSAERTTAGVVIQVRDDGIGIAPEDIERVTERFFRVDRSRSRGEGGTGLGLSIVKHILEAHGSRLEIASKPGEGSVFAFRLPAEAGGSTGTVIETPRVSPPPPAGP